MIFIKYHIASGSAMSGKVFAVVFCPFIATDAR